MPTLSVTVVNEGEGQNGINNVTENESVTTPSTFTIVNEEECQHTKDFKISTPIITVVKEEEIKNQQVQFEPAPKNYDENQICVIDNSFTLELPQFEDNVNAQSHYLNHIVVNTNKNEVYSCTLSLNDLSNNSKGIYLLANFAGKNTAMLVDTGASISVMAKKVFDGLETKPILEPSKLKVYSVSGERILSYGRTPIPFSIGEKTYFPTFEIVDIPEKIILGMSVMTALNGVIDMNARKIHLAGVKLPCLILDGQPKPQRVLVAKITTVEPGTEMIVPGELGDCTITSKTFSESPRSCSTVPVLFEPTNTFCEKSGLMACPIVTMNKSRVPFRVYNPHDKPIKLKKGTFCGFVSPVDQVEDVINTSDMDQKEETISSISDKIDDKGDDLPNHLGDMYKEACENMDEKSRKVFLDLLIKYQKVFSKGDYDIGRTSLVKHTIETGDSAPIKQAPRRLPLIQQEEVDRQVNNLIKAGMVTPSNSSWASPIVLVRKKDGSQRMCCDYRLLNSCTIKDAHPLPRADQAIDNLYGMKYFCSLDLASGYYQVEMDEDAQEKSSFCTRTGLYKWKVLSFGLTNGPATFQRLMERVLKGLHWSILMVYLDDILIYGTSIPQVIARLETVFKRLDEANLKLKPKKCHLFQKQLLFLGFQISEQGVHTDPSKVQAIKDFNTPKTVSEVRTWLGVTGYYRKFVKDYATLAFPLNRLLDKDLPFQWTKACDEAFIALKNSLITAPILGMPSLEGIMILDTDASNFGLGGVLSQIQDDKEVVLAYSSKAMSKQERQYCVTRQELLSIVYHIKHFKVYLWGRHFKVRTDHSSLKYLVSFKEPEGQLCRWLDALSEYDFEIMTRPGKSHGNADFMSRGPCGGKRCYCTYSCSDPTLDEFDNEPCPLRQMENSHNDEESDRLSPKFKPDVDLQNHEALFHIHQVDEIKDNQSETEISVESKNLNSDYPFPWTLESMTKAQTKDLCIGAIVEWMKKGVKPKWSEVSDLPEEAKQLLGSWKLLFMDNGLLYRKWIDTESRNQLIQLVIPSVYRNSILKEMHDSVTAGHLGISKVYSKILHKYFWPDMKNQVTWWINSCLVCQRKKNPQKKFCAPLNQYITGSRFTRIAMDIQGPIVETERGNKYILVVSDYFSKWVEAYPMHNQTTETIAGIFVREWISRFGCPSFLHTDLGANLKSAVMKAICDLLGIIKTHTVARNPQSDGQVERFNRTVQQILAKTVEDKPFDWDLYLPFAVMAYRSSKHESTSQTPNMLVFGAENILPLEAFTPDTPDKHEFSTPEYCLHLQEQLKYAHEKAFMSLHRAAKYQRRGYLPKLNPNKYKLKDSVWYWLPRCKKNQAPKLSSFWDGPYFVTKIYSDVLYLIQKSARHKPRVVHHNQIKPCYLRGDVDNSWLDKIWKSNQKESVTNHNGIVENHSVMPVPQSRPQRSKKPVNRLGDWFYDV